MLETATEQDLVKQAENARFAKKLKNLKPGDRVYCWKPSNRGGANPMLALVFAVFADRLKLRAFPEKGPSQGIDGAVHWKHKSFEEFPEREEHMWSWAFIEEVYQPS
jgi:hypothetical protein